MNNTSKEQVKGIEGGLVRVKQQKGGGKDRGWVVRQRTEKGIWNDPFKKDHALGEKQEGKKGRIADQAFT